MNISKFTQKSIQAVQDLEKIAYEYGNQEIEQEHLLYALLTQEDSLILKLIEKMEINKDYFLNTVKTALDAKVKVSGGRPEVRTVSEQGACERGGRSQSHGRRVCFCGASVPVPAETAQSRYEEDFL